MVSATELMLPNRPASSVPTRLLAAQRAASRLCARRARSYAPIVTAAPTSTAIRIQAIAPGLFHVPPAVDADGFTGDEVAVEQREHTLGDLDLTAPATERRRAFDAAKFLI